GYADGTNVPIGVSAVTVPSAMRAASSAPVKVFVIEPISNGVSASTPSPAAANSMPAGVTNATAMSRVRSAATYASTASCNAASGAGAASAATTTNATATR